jgi:glycosyl transferase, family 25
VTGTADLIRSTFGTVRIINLPSRADRRRDTDRELARIGLAADGRDIAYVAAERPSDAGGFETAGARGCFLSHLGVLRQMLAEGAAGVLILEDDVTFAKDLRDRLGGMLAGLDAISWSIFYGGHEALATEDLERFGPLRIIPPERGVQTTHCIAVRRDAAARLVPYFSAMLERPQGSPDGGPMHVDGAYGWFRAAHPEFRTLAACPPIARQRPSRTDVHALALTDRLPGLRELKQLARRARYRFG